MVIALKETNMSKTIIIALKSGLQSKTRQKNQMEQLYGTNHILATTLAMEEKEIRDYIYNLENPDKKKGA